MHSLCSAGHTAPLRQNFAGGVRAPPNSSSAGAERQRLCAEHFPELMWCRMYPYVKLLKQVPLSQKIGTARLGGLVKAAGHESAQEPTASEPFPSRWVLLRSTQAGAARLRPRRRHGRHTTEERHRGTVRSPGWLQSAAPAVLHLVRPLSRSHQGDSLPLHATTRGCTGLQEASATTARPIRKQTHARLESRASPPMRWQRNAPPFASPRGSMTAPRQGGSQTAQAPSAPKRDCRRVKKGLNPSRRGGGNRCDAKTREPADKH